MSKYRIIKHEYPNNRVEYEVQKKILGLFWLNWANVNAWTTGWYRTIKEAEFAIKMEREKDLRTIVKYYE